MSQRVIDFHTHAFPDALAPRAMQTLLSEAPGIAAYSDGTVGALLKSMDAAGIETSVVCSIATKIDQFEPILGWCRQIRSDRLIPFPSVHPADPKMAERIDRIAAEGFLGVKLHPFYQDFYAAQDSMLKYYEQVIRRDLLLVIHTGFDIAFPRQRRADPKAMLDVSERFPELKLVVTHLGAWQQWDEVRRHLLGRPIYMEISLAMEDLGDDVSREMLMGHPAEYLLFGTDSPWSDQTTTLSRLRSLDLPEPRLSRMVYRNAAGLLGQPVKPN
ncbi:MAG TPA: amidohydrolase family protein [Sedimentisphaerales bacterium]|nr:amidohydrolase family protein [Sedimentisphaerales bacterium]HRS11008.1 amidohydrolase family protein [Sedimentisphaerales bacterium]HRV49276.1 amidohydrolase family protein [Sedimentisphaerales bacterium]